jgi:predicted nucleic acid-binding protein
MTDSEQTFVYVDANPFIYAFEGAESLAVALNGLFAFFGKHPGMALTSELTLAEVLPKARVPEGYLELMVSSGIFELKPITPSILVETADYRRATMVTLPDGRQVMPRLPDAIHVVTAIRSGCRILLSTDSRLKVPAGMRVVEASEVGITELLRELA